MKFSLPAKKMILVICVAALIVMLGGAIYYRSLEALNFVLGVFLTSALNVFKVYLLERNVQKILYMTDPGASKGYFSVQYLIRYVLTGAVLVAAALIPFINLWGALIGAFTLQAATIAIRFMKVDNDEAAEYAAGEESEETAEVRAIEKAAEKAIEEPGSGDD